MKWYDMDEIQKIKQVYSKYTIEDFWNFWSGNQNKVMEIRIKDYNLIKEISYNYKIPKSPSGLYVDNAKDLEKVIKLLRDKVTMWFGINSRKKSRNKYGTISYGGKDDNISEISHIFIDIDRRDKDGPAKNFDLYDIEILCNSIIKEFSKMGFCNSYLKLASGNGIQLILELDEPIIMPQLEYDQNTKGYITTDEFEKKKMLLKEAIGKQLLKFTSKYKNDLNADVDISGFNIGRVGGMPFTKNFKYDSYTWRGILEIKKEGPNKGLTEFLLEAAKDIKIYKSANILTEKSKLPSEDKIIPGKMSENRVVSLLLDYDLSTVNGLNDYIWKDLKSLFYESGIIDSNCNPKEEYAEEFFDIHRKIIAKQKRPNFSLNLPDPNKYKFNRDNINKFCRRPDVLIAPLFPMFRNTRPIQIKDLPIRIYNIEEVPTNTEPLNITEGFVDTTELMHILYETLNNIRDGYDDDPYMVESVNILQRAQKIQNKYNSFLLGFYNYFGKDVTDYYVKYIFNEYFNRRGK